MPIAGDGGAYRSASGLHAYVTDARSLANNGATNDLHIAGVFLRDLKPWSFVVTIGTPRRARPLGHHLVAGRFARLASLAVCAEMLG
jgi:hypothetical protein